MIKRPKPGEDEEDILRMQEEFIREKNKNGSLTPSAQVLNLRRTEHRTTKRSNVIEPNTRKPSVYAQFRGHSQNEKKNDEIPRKQEENRMELTKEEEHDDKVYFPKLIPAVMGEIVQRNYNVFYDVDRLLEPMPSEGFPTVTKHERTSVSDRKPIHVLLKESRPSNKSTHMDIDEMSPKIPSVPSSSQESITDPLNLPSKSFILSHDDANDIHCENVELLKKMSEKEILDEQKKLLSSLDPKLVSFVKNRRLTSIENTETSDFTKNEKLERMAIEQVESNNQNDDDEMMWDNDILSHPEVNSWLHFDSLEKDKLQWMKGIKESETVKPNEPYEARFNFNGYLLPYTIKYTENTKTLFHHGEEPHRPGYTISELIELSRSSITQQRVVALNAIAGLLEYYSAGVYKGIINLPLSKIFFVIRFAMDENKVIILEPALKAMRNLLYNRIDEACLDALLGFEEGTLQPCLENDKSEIEEIDATESELKDFHLAEIDIIAAILRTDILQRLYYILDIIRPNFNCVQYSLQILIRLARDSIETANKIIQTEHLIRTIIRNFIPTTGLNFRFDPHIVYNGKPMLTALKLMRILSLQSRHTGDIIISKYSILKPISEYISSGVDGTYGLRLQIESYCILTNLIQYDLGIDDVIALLPVILTTLYKHIQSTDIFINSVVVSSTHAAVVLQLINKLFNCNSFDVTKYGTQMYTLIKEGLEKWMAQVTNIDAYTCGHMRVICSALECCNSIMKKAKVCFPFLSNSLIALAKSKGIKYIMDNLILNSNLLSGIEDKDLNFTPNLMSLGGAAIDTAQKVLPVLNLTSPVPFLLSLFKILVTVQDPKISDPYVEMVVPYLRKLINVVPSLSLNWFTRMETDLVYNMIILSVQSKINENIKDMIYVAANKLCFILRVDNKNELNFLFDNIIFNKQWFTTERLFNLMSLSEAEGLSKALYSIEDIKLCYSRVIKLRNPEDTPNIVLRNWQEPLLPRDWIYLPILSLYTKIQESPTNIIKVADITRGPLMIEQEKELILRCTLEWILFNELCFPDLLDDIYVTDRLCRIMCVFLCDNSLFLQKNIKFLLYNCLKRLFKKPTEFNFDKPLTGLNNFQDFYTQLLEQFQSVSYGDHNFAACILVPLAQHHNIKWRKTLWSEYAGCLRALDCPDDYLCYGLNKYLQPEETDESLIKCYFRALSSNLLRPGTIVYKIASHHVEFFKNRMQLDVNISKVQT